MDIKTLLDTPPWEWPRDAGKTFLKVLTNRQASASDRLIAAELAGDFVVINDELANGLMTVLGSANESEELRAQAAVSFGPALETVEIDGFDDAGVAHLRFAQRGNPGFSHIGHGTTD